MKNQKQLWFIVFAVIVVAAIWFLRKPNRQQEAAINSVTSTNPAPAHNPATNQLPMTTVNANTNLSNGSKIPADITTRYRQGLIDKGEAMRETFANQNNQPQDYYGKIIDQYGQPISNVEVTGNLRVMGGLGDGAKNQTYKTRSDSDGLFEFIGIRGWRLGVAVKKEGYLMGGHGEGYKEPSREEMSPSNRAILTMWKLRGAEILTSQSFKARIPCDGTPIAFDIATGKISPNGDLQITLLRSPLEVRRGKDLFNWIFKIQMLRGGLIAENDPYPYRAPENGYESSFEFDVSSNNVPWTSTMTQNFYIQTSGGQYGRMQAKVYTAFTPAEVEFNFTINPSSSQNLEPASTE